MILTEKQAKYWGDKPARVLFCAQQIPHSLAWGRISASAMRRRLVSNPLHHGTRERPSRSEYTGRNTIQVNLKGSKLSLQVIIIIIINIIIIFMKAQACFLFLNPQDEVGPSISSSVVLCSFVFWVDTVVLVLVFYLCPSSVRVVATFLGTVFFPLLCSVLPFSMQCNNIVSHTEFIFSAFSDAYTCKPL